MSILLGKARRGGRYTAALLGHCISPSKIYAEPRSAGRVNRLRPLVGEWQDHITKEHARGGIVAAIFGNTI